MLHEQRLRDGEALVSNPSLVLQVSPAGDVRTLYSDSVYLPTVHPDGPLVVEEDSGDGINGRLTTVDIGYGGGGRQWPLVGMGGKPAVLEDGSIVVVTSKYVEPFGIGLTINHAYLDGRVETTPIAGCQSPTACAASETYCETQLFGQKSADRLRMTSSESRTRRTTSKSKPR